MVSQQPAIRVQGFGLVDGTIRRWWRGHSVCAMGGAGNAGPRLSDWLTESGVRVVRMGRDRKKQRYQEDHRSCACRDLQEKVERVRTRIVAAEDDETEAQMDQRQKKEKAHRTTHLSAGLRNQKRKHQGANGNEEKNGDADDQVKSDESEEVVDQGHGFPIVTIPDPERLSSERELIALDARRETINGGNVHQPSAISHQPALFRFARLPKAVRSRP